MPHLDRFSASLVEMVRDLPDDELLALVRHHLAAVAPSSVEAPANAVPRGERRKRKRGGRRRGGRSSATEAALAQVESTITGSRGLSASEVAAATNLAQMRVARLIRILKDERRIVQGGDRRFARYAGDAATAVAASERARQTARGPVRRR